MSTLFDRGGTPGKLLKLVFGGGHVVRKGGIRIKPSRKGGPFWRERGLNRPVDPLNIFTKGIAK